MLAVTVALLAFAHTLPALAACANTTVPSADITYAYDPDGRLIGVVNASGSAATYQYDVVGNLLSISRPTTSVSALSLSPNNGPVGTCVTVYGYGYSSTPSQNTVTFFGGSNSTALYATPTSIVVAVPSGAFTGPVSVTSPSGMASGPSFTVPLF
jgi:YD repeat-containing protein